MLRKLTAVMFLLVMTLLITLKHPVFGYCFCLDTYFTGDCVCQVEEKVVSETASCCSGCASDTVSIESEKLPTPCDDCTKPLNVDVGDFIWNSSAHAPADTETLQDSVIVFHDFKNQAPKPYFYNPKAIRGDPLTEIYDIGVPLYLKHSVLRL